MSIRGFPFFILKILLRSLCLGQYATIQAGLLTFGSTYSPRLPIPIHRNSGMLAAFVPDYSGGPVPDLHEVPFYAQYKHLNVPCR
jgi:hypothetical protein